MVRKKICVIGHFGFGENLLNGQTIKTKVITKELIRQLGKSKIVKIDSHGGKKAMLRITLRVKKAMRFCGNVIIMPANNGLMFFAPLLTFLHKIYPIPKLHYIVIGGWLAEFIKDKKCIQKCLKKFDGIYVETSTMKKELEKIGFNNIYMMPNCKEIQILREDEIVCSYVEPLKLCTFSRVMKEKGIEDITSAVKEINEKFERTVFLLDIYGQVDIGYMSNFEKLQSEFPEYIKYKGTIPFDKSTDVLRRYFALVFPTRFYTEGVPGTLIDAYASGLPVISAKWESFSDVVEDGVVGYGFEFKDYGHLVQTLMYVANNPDSLCKLKKNCLKKAEEFTSDKVVGEFIRRVF